MKQLKIIEETTEEMFLILVNDFLRTNKVYSQKFQRNLYYNKQSELVSRYVAFLVYKK